MTDYTKLRELAQAADDLAPGDWSHLYEFLKEDIWEKADAEFIAAANPTVVLALLDELRAAKAQALRDAARGFAEADLGSDLPVHWLNDRADELENK